MFIVSSPCTVASVPPRNEQGRHGNDDLAFVVSRYDVAGHVGHVWILAYVSPARRLGVNRARHFVQVRLHQGDSFRDFCVLVMYDLARCPSDSCRGHRFVLSAS